MAQWKSTGDHVQQGQNDHDDQGIDATEYADIDQNDLQLLGITVDEFVKFMEVFDSKQKSADAEKNERVS